MNIEAIRERLEDFRPFAVVASSGNRYRIPYPDFLFIHPTHSRTVVIGTEQGVVVLDPLHIVGLEDLHPRKNGRNKRGRGRN